MYKYALWLARVCARARALPLPFSLSFFPACVYVYVYAYMLFYALSIYVYSFFYGYQPGSPFILFQRRRREPNEKLKRAEEKSRNKRAGG